MPAIARNGYFYGASPQLPIDAEDVRYDNSTSELESTDVQSAIGELKELIDEGGGPQVQSDWTETDTSSDAYIQNKPTLGSAASKNVPTSGNASTTEVVMGSDTRLSDARNASDVYSWAKAETKPSYTAAEVGAIASTEKGANGGVAELDSAGKVPSSQLPSYVDDVLEYNSISDFPLTGETGKIYIAKDTNKTYRWSGTAYAEISESLTLGETSSTAYAGNKGKANADAIAAIKDGTSIDSFSDVETALNGKVDSSSLYNLIYPVGSVYISVANINPSTMFGGTWELMGDGYLRNNASEASGGSMTSGSTTLTEQQIPAHSHTATSSSAGSHTHTSTTQSNGSHTHTSTTGSYGNHTHTATTQNTGAHTHTLTTNSTGGHTHTATTQTAGSHSHNVQTAPFTWNPSGTQAMNSYGTSGNYTTAAAGDHSHTLTTNNQGDHTHTATTGSYGNHTHTLTTQNTGAHTHTLTTDSQGAHTHTLTTDSQGAHTHTLTTSSTGGGTGHTHSIEPTYIGVYAFKRTA